MPCSKRLPLAPLSLALLLFGCASLVQQPSAWEAQGTPPPLRARPKLDESAPTHSVVLITIDGARWQEVFLGVDPARASGDESALSASRLLPNLYRHIASRGVVLGAPGHGEPMLASGPQFISLPGYMEILSGRPSRDCELNQCAQITRPTLLDDLRGAPGLGDDQIAVIGSWDMLGRAASRDPSWLTVSVGRHGGATRARLRVDPLSEHALDEGTFASAWPGDEDTDYRPDRYTAPLALRYLAARRPRFLWIGLGDTDEFAHHGNYAGYIDALRFADKVIGDVVSTVSAFGDGGASTTIVITTDHGRSRSFEDHGRQWPESSRVWLFAAGGAVPSRGYVSLTRPGRLCDIAPSLRALLGLPGDAHPDAGRALSALAPLPSLNVEPRASR